MNEKEFNRTILAELKPIAKEVFEWMNIHPGTYTAAELASCKKGKEEIKISMPDRIRETTHFVSVGSFRCKFPSEKVFELIYKFEKLSGVGQKDKLHFVRMNETDDIYFSFFADFGKGIKWAANHVGNDNVYPTMNHALLNFERSEIVATDGHILSVTNLPITEPCGEPLNFPILLNMEMIKSLKGKCYIQMMKDGITAEDESGMQYTHEYELNRYPNYLDVIPDVSDELRATFTPYSVKSIFSLLKTAKKTCRIFHLDIRKGERMAKITPVNLYYYYEVPSIQVELSECPKSEIHVSFMIETFICAKNWDGRIWFGCDNSRAVVLGDKFAKFTVIMPQCKYDELCYSYKPMKTYDAFDAVCGTIAKEGQKTPNLTSHYIVEDVAERISQANPAYNVPSLYCVPDSIVAGFIKSLCAMLSILYDMTFFITLNDAIKQIRQLAYLSGKDFSELINMKAAPARAVPDKPDEIVHDTVTRPCLNYKIHPYLRILRYFRPLMGEISGVDKYTPARVSMSVNARIEAIQIELLNVRYESSSCADVRIVGYFHIRGPTIRISPQLAHN